jgi:hypothetical protein
MLSLFSTPFSQLLAQSKAPAPEPVDPTKPEAIKTSGFVITGEKEGLFLVDNKKFLYPQGTRVILVRLLKKENEVDILATGVIEGQQGSTTFIKVDFETILKFPKAGDFVLTMGDPWVPGADPEEPKKERELKVEKEPLPDEPGYIQYTQGNFSGTMVGNDSPNEVNLYKKSSFSFPYTHFAWYFEFVWRFGIEFESFTGNFPTFSYYRDEEATAADFSSVTLNYRLRRYLWDTLRITPRIVRFTDAFTTTNPDEAVISTTVSGTGLGVHLGLELFDPTWKPKGRIGLVPQQLYFDVHQFLMMDALDVGVLRGSSAQGSTGMDMRIGASVLIYVGWIPWFKRFVIEGFYGKRSYNLTFTGPTTGPTDRNYVIPEGQSYKETMDYFQLSFGVRMDDFIGGFFMPR